MPKNSKHSFKILSENGLFDQTLAGRLSNMAGLHNMAVQEYSPPGVAVVKNIIEKHLGDFRDFVNATLQCV